jgi:hypothetical protein
LVPRSLCIEAVRALELLGHDAEVARAECVVSLGRELSTPLPILHVPDHQVVFSRSADRFADPAVLHLFDLPTRPDLMEPRLVIAPAVTGVDSGLWMVFDVTRPPLAMRYEIEVPSMSPSDSVSSAETGWTWREFLWALHGLVCAESVDDIRVLATPGPR